MKSLCVILLLLPVLANGDTLDNRCGKTTAVFSFTDTYRVVSSSTYATDCTVTFQRNRAYGGIQMIVSGSDLRTSDCQVSVTDSFDSFGVTKFRSIDRYGFFSKTVKSSTTSGALKLRISGPRCGSAGLSFDVKESSCPAFTCDNGQCMPYSDVCDNFDDCDDGSDEYGCVYWSSGSYIGLSIGIFFFVAIVGAISAVVYRRRVVMVRTTGVVNQNHMVVTQSRW